MTPLDDILIRYSQIGKIFDCLSLGVIILSIDRKIVSFNRSAEVLTNYSEEDVVGKYCYEIFMDFLCGGKCKFLESEDSEKKTLVSRIEFTDQKNTIYTISKIESPIYNADNNIIGCIEIFQDHSFVKELIKIKRFEDRKLKIILDNLNIGLFTVDRGNKISFFNSQAEDMTGFSRSELLGRPCGQIFGKDFCKNYLKQTSSAEKKGDRIDVETKIVTKEGNAVPVQANYMPLKNEDETIVGGLTTISDLSLKYQFKSAIKDRYTYYDMVGKHPDMQKVLEIIPVVSASDATILIEGPTGTGKNLLAKIIHNTSKRSNKKMIKVNCASLPDNLLESEMFGYVKGAFTGADKDKPGRFQLANKGTIFLDEIGDLPLPMQAKLLHVLEDKEFYPLGSRQTTRVDVRIISASNQNLGHLIDNKLFREDLFYRLNVMRMEIPPLNERKSDLPLLISHILKRLCATRDTHVHKISENAMEVLLNYDYPGNVRELENILEHALIICQEKIIEKRHFPLWLLKSMNRNSSVHRIDDRMDDTIQRESNYDEKMSIINMLDKCKWNKGMTAQALSMDRTTLWRKMKKYGIAAK